MLAATLSPLETALQHLDKGNIRAAYPILESIPIGNEDFVDAMIELQKIHYRLQNWQKFFAYAQFYRQKLLVSQKNIPIRARMLSLEIMALAKHCQWKAAQAVLQWTLEQKDRMDKNEWQEILLTKEFFELQSHFPQEKADVDEKAPIAKIFSDKQVWKIESRDLTLLTHPKNLSVQLKSECKE